MNRKQKLIAAAALAAVAATWAIPAQAGRTLNAVKSRGMVVCGVNTAAPGFSGADSRGHWKGLDVDICRAVAAAVLKDANKVKFVPLSSEQRFTALQSGQIDILARNTTWSMSRDASQGSVFVAMDYLDGQGFMVPKKYKIHSAKQLNGATICVQTGTSSEKNLADFARANNIKYKPVVFSTTEATQGAFISGRCQAYTTDRSDLAGARLRAKNPNDYVILPETISKEPLGMAIRRGDDDWFQIVRWSFYTMVEAEELGITQKNADSLRSSKNPNVRRLLGLEEDLGRMIGLDKQWSYRIIKQVGNYGESFEANLGPKTPLGLSRGLNRLWTKGGILISPPIRWCIFFKQGLLPTAARGKPAPRPASRLNFLGCLCFSDRNRLSLRVMPPGSRGSAAGDSGS